ncbi:hypothetical protein Tco_0174548 [Tanacetum coccineum]
MILVRYPQMSHKETQLTTQLLSLTLQQLIMIQLVNLHSVVPLPPLEKLTGADTKEKLFKLRKLILSKQCSIRESLSHLNNSEDIAAAGHCRHGCFGAHYLPHSSEYVAPPSIDIVRPWFETIGYGEAVPAKGTLKKESFSS